MSRIFLVAKNASNADITKATIPFNPKKAQNPQQNPLSFHFISLRHGFWYTVTKT